MFDGRNITSGLPDELVKVVDFLNEKASAGEFEFSDSVSYWENNEHIINPSDYSMSGGYFAVALAYIAHLKVVILFSRKLIILGDGRGHFILFPESQVGVQNL